MTGINRQLKKGMLCFSKHRIYFLVSNYQHWTKDYKTLMIDFNDEEQFGEMKFISLFAQSYLATMKPFYHNGELKEFETSTQRFVREIMEEEI